MVRIVRSLTESSLRSLKCFAAISVPTLSLLIWVSCVTCTETKVENTIIQSYPVSGLKRKPLELSCQGWVLMSGTLLWSKHRSYLNYCSPDSWEQFSFPFWGRLKRFLRTLLKLMTEEVVTQAKHGSDLAVPRPVSFTFPDAWKSTKNEITNPLQ